MKAEEIRALREALNLTQERLAQIIGCSLHTLNRWERDKSSPSRVYKKILEKVLKGKRNDT